MVFKNNKGLSIVELLISISIFSIVSLTLYSTFANGLRLSKQANRNEQFYRGVRWSFDTVTQDLENMIPYNLPEVEEGSIHEVIVEGQTSLDADEQKMSFYGSKNKISLLLATKQGLSIVRYYLDDPEDALINKTTLGFRSDKNVDIDLKNSQSVNMVSFVREEMPLVVLDQQGQTQQPFVEILSQNVEAESLQFQYLQKKENDKWLATWEEDFFPAGVRIKMVFCDPNEPMNKHEYYKNILIPLSGK